MLGGTRKDEFILSWGGAVAFDGPNPDRDYTNLKSGDWCGTPRDGGGAPEEWVHKLFMQLT